MLLRSPLLKDIYQQNKFRLFVVYALNILEESAYLAVPAASGMLIDSFLNGTTNGIVIFSAVYLGWNILGVLRKALDTISFTKIYNDVTIKIIEHHKAKNIDTGKINARIELLREVVTFFETDLPFLANSFVTMLGAAGLLYFYNPQLMLICLVIIVPSLIVNYWFGKKMVAATTAVNNEYEKQLDIIENENLDGIRHYLQNIRRINIRKSTLEAVNFGTLEIFVFTMIFASIYIVCHTPNIDYGAIVAIYGYILKFAYSFDFIPHLTERMALMSDIQHRLAEVYQEDGEPL